MIFERSLIRMVFCVLLNESFCAVNLFCIAAAAGALNRTISLCNTNIRL